MVLIESHYHIGSKSCDFLSFSCKKWLSYSNNLIVAITPNKLHPTKTMQWPVFNGDLGYQARLNIQSCAWFGMTSPLIRKLSRAKQRAHQEQNPAWKALSKILSQQLRKQLSLKTSEKVNNTVTGSKSWWRNLKQLTGEQHQVSAAPLISMNDNWLNKSQFVKQLIDYYLQDHNSFSPDYPTIPYQLIGVVHLRSSM